MCVSVRTSPSGKNNHHIRTCVSLCTTQQNFTIYVPCEEGKHSLRIGHFEIFFLQFTPTIEISFGHRFENQKNSSDPRTDDVPQPANFKITSQNNANVNIHLPASVNK